MYLLVNIEVQHESFQHFVHEIRHAYKLQSAE